MYGLVNKAIQALVIDAKGNDIWEVVKRKAGVDEPAFISMQNYPDEITYNLVAAASEILDTPPEEILRLFGRHWILYTAKVGYGDLLDVNGQTFLEFINNLDAMHARIASTMPELSPPSFECLNIDKNTIEVHYFSERVGLCPMVKGLLEGLGERFQMRIIVEQLPRAAADNFDRFQITILE
jgi:hypothetical protein